MRIAAIYDIHGNLPALEAVLQEIAQADVELVVVGGDVVAGPMPRETLKRLLDLAIPVQCIQGNADREVLEQLAGTELDALPQDARQIAQWVARQLQPEDLRLLAAWPKTARIKTEELGEVLFCHATPRSDTEILTRATPEDRLIPIFAGLDVSLVVCGHTHMQFDRKVDTMRVLNAGSVGMPYGEPDAYWLLLGPDVQFRRTRYDHGRAAARIRATDYPQAHDFAANNVLHPPTEAEALAVFTRLEAGKRDAGGG